MTALYLLALELAQLRRTLPQHEIQRHVRELRDVPDQIRKILEGSQSIAQLAERFWRYSDFLYLGRGINCPIAMEGALKLKEISYIHAEGYAAGEMKHGPIALIDAEMPVVVIQELMDCDVGFLCDLTRTVRTWSWTPHNVVGDRRVTTRDRIEKTVKRREGVLGTILTTRHPFQRLQQNRFVDEDDV